MENVWDKVLNWIFNTDAIIGCKFDVQQSCRARRAGSYGSKLILDLFSEFREKF